MYFMDLRSTLDGNRVSKVLRKEDETPYSVTFPLSVISVALSKGSRLMPMGK
jgi:hypothetical protein